MRKVSLGFFLIILSCLSLQAQIENDKIAHFGVGAVAGAGGAFLASELSNQNRFWTVTGSIASSLLVGLAKEAIDERNSNSWDNADLGATVLGGVTVGITIELFSKKNGKRYQSKNRKMGSDQLNSSSAELLFMSRENSQFELANFKANE